MKAEGKGSKAPLAESFGQWKNLKIVLLALFGAAAGQGVVWYTGQFYALFFLPGTLKIDVEDRLPRSSPSRCCSARRFFVFFGWLSDRIGRQEDHDGRAASSRALTYFPIFKAMTHFGNPALEPFAASTQISLTATDCQVHIFPIAQDGVQRVRQDSGLPVQAQPVLPRPAEPLPARRPTITINDQVIDGWDEAKLIGRAEAARLSGHGDRARTSTSRW